MKKIKAQVILKSRHISELNTKIAEKITEGWQPVGAHTAITTHEQLRYSGMQHKDTIFEYEYAQTMVQYEE